MALKSELTFANKFISLKYKFPDYDKDLFRIIYNGDIAIKELSGLESDPSDAPYKTK
jgi:hypothetical protein